MTRAKEPSPPAKNGSGWHWLRPPLAAALCGVAATAVGLWAQAQVIQSQISDHGRRIERLETGGERSGQLMAGIQADLAVVKADSAALKEDTRDIMQKLDMLIERQLRVDAAP